EGGGEVRAGGAAPPQRAAGPAGRPGRGARVRGGLGRHARHPRRRDPVLMTGDASSLLEAARWYHARGYAPIPLPAGAKRPALRGWARLRRAADELPRHFNGAGNIGLLLGEPSGWLVDVDLDCEEAIELADEHLPPTGAVTGRPSRPGSHRWYLCEQ